MPKLENSLVADKFQPLCCMGNGYIAPEKTARGRELVGRVRRDKDWKKAGQGINGKNGTPFSTVNTP
jgi:hypothetical protein